MPSQLARLVGTLFLAAPLIAQTPGACFLNDSAFNTQEGGCKDLVSNLVWSAATGTMTWNQANAYAINLVEGGYSDWRLPTLPELQEAFANGGTSHLALGCQPCGGGVYVGWSSKLKGNAHGQNFKAWVLDWMSGNVQLILGSSRVFFNCVRQGSSSFTGGGNNPPPPLPVSTTGHGNGVTHFLEDGRWIAHVDLPAHLNAPYCMVVLHDPKPNAPRAPVLDAGVDLLAATTGSQVMNSLGKLDAIGHATLLVDARALGLQSPAFRELTILLLIPDPKSAVPLVYRIRLPG